MTLLAMMGDKMVASQTINTDNELGVSGGGSNTIGASTIEFSGVEFDSLLLFANGPGLGGSILFSIDNLTIGTESCLGDLDGNSAIDTADLLALFAQWGANVGSPADLDDDGIVNTSDLLLLFANWGPC